MEQGLAHTHTQRARQSLHSAWGLGACNFSHLGFFSFHRAKSAEKQDSEASIHSTALAVKALVAQLIEMFPEGCGRDLTPEDGGRLGRPLLHGFLWILIESCVAIPYLLTPLLRWEMLSRSIKYTLIKQYTSVAFGASMQYALLIQMFRRSARPRCKIAAFRAEYPCKIWRLFRSSIETFTGTKDEQAAQAAAPAW